MSGLKLILGVIVLTGGFAQAESIAPILGAKWQMTQESSFCQLSQEIPGFGSVDFQHYSGDDLTFSLQETQLNSPVTRASLLIESAPWIHHRPPVTDHPVYLDFNELFPGASRLSVFGASAETMLEALQNGYFPTFRFVRANQAQHLNAETVVAVSAMNFQTAYQNFVSCRSGFLPPGFKDELEKSLFYNPRSVVLDTVFLKRLGETVRFVNAIENAEVVIESDARIGGNLDLIWFRQRAAKIADYLKQKGINAQKIRINTAKPIERKDRKQVRLGVFGPDALNIIYYRKGNTQLTQTEKKRLRLLMTYWQNYKPDSRLFIHSHTDGQGRRRTNQVISQKRAEVIKNYLISQNIDADKIVMKAYGESRPAKSNRFEPGRQQNRRVELVFAP